MKFIFGTYLENSIGTYKNIIKIYNRFIYGCNEDIILDFSNTKRFESNLMAVLYLVIEDAYKKNIDVKFILPDNKELLEKMVHISALTIILMKNIVGHFLNQDV